MACFSFVHFLKSKRLRLDSPQNDTLIVSLNATWYDTVNILFVKHSSYLITLNLRISTLFPFLTVQKYVPVGRFVISIASFAINSFFNKTFP